ncbi:CheR family methyltransferase [Methylophilus sp.]|uniref:CheR family methyltransferase n=1 Tax=Methylophilus sp. TaxID=29541 RepID=UPI004035A1F2
MQLQDAEIEVKLLIDAIYLKYNYDFRDYSKASQKRRIEQGITALKCQTISELQSQVLHDPAVFMQLLQYLTIPVSEMFRDPSYFLSIREQVVPVLKTYPSLKIWVAGCSTGEEAYSLAILLQEEGLLERSIIYATDINPVSLEKAKKGVFPLERMALYGDNYQAAGGKRSLEHYYTGAYGGALFDKGLAEKITFSDHSLATDSVFSETHFVSCRNVVIYFNKALQGRAYNLFYESLCRRGFLGLGHKESLDFSTCSHLFEAVVKKDKLFRKL